MLPSFCTHAHLTHVYPPPPPPEHTEGDDDILAALAEPKRKKPLRPPPPRSQSLPARAIDAILDDDGMDIPGVEPPPPYTPPLCAMNGQGTGACSSVCHTHTHKHTYTHAHTNTLKMHIQCVQIIYVPTYPYILCKFSA